MAEFGGASIGGVAPWGMTVAPGGGGAWEGKPVATPPGWGPGGAGVPWPQGGGGAAGGGGGVSDTLLDAIQKQQGYHPGSISYEQNNPGNLKWGAFAKSMGATGPGRGGHAIFPSYEAGRAALKQLIETKGKSPSEISQWYAEGPQGGMHWARGVAKFAGVDPSHVPAPSAPQTTTTTGITTDEKGKTIDSATAQQAQALGQRGDIAGLQRLFAARGYHMSGPACGIVASKYAREAGYEPPKGGAVATSLRQFGQSMSAEDVNAPGGAGSVRCLRPTGTADTAAIQISCCDRAISAAM